jgi:chaperonin GroES
MKQLKAQFNAIIVKPIDKEEQSYGNIIVPDLGKEKALRGTIVSVGPGSYSVTGNWIPTVLKEGNEVILPSLGPTKIDFDGIEYWTCPENMVAAIIEDEIIEVEVTNHNNDDDLPF